MVRDKRESKRGYKFLDVEDPTGEMTILITKENRSVDAIFDNILPDEVIGIRGRMHNDIFIASEIVEPELPINHRTTACEDPINVGFLSDILLLQLFAKVLLGQ